MAEDIETGTGKSQSRRELLKKLGAAAGALVWATPVVQTISTATAHANHRPGHGRGPTTTTVPGTTTTTGAGGAGCAPGGGSGSDQGKSSTHAVQYEPRAAEATTTTRHGVSEAKSGSGCVEVSHIDLLVCRGIVCVERYGVKWDPGEGWSKHPKGKGADCLGSSGWAQPPNSFELNDFPTPVVLPGGSYRVTLPADVKVWGGWSKAGQKCQPATNVGGNSWQFDPWCPTPTTTTTTTTQPTTTTTTSGGGGGGGGGGGASTTTTTQHGGTDNCGSPSPGKDISHMDWILCRGSVVGNGTVTNPDVPCTDRFGVQYDFGGGWGPHPSGPISSQHCLAGRSWRVPSSGFSYAGFGSAVSLGGGAYRITLPVDVTVLEAYSKCGQACRSATHLGGNTWRFDPC